MPIGSPRPAAGRMPDPSSDSFQKRAGGLFAIPASGYRKRHPKFPLTRYEVMVEWQDDNGRHREKDAEASERWNAREAEVWDELWHLPQGFAWSRPQYKYLQHSVALYVRQYVLCESSDAKAADRTTLCRYADVIGLTPQGLRINGWRVVADEPDEVKRPAKAVARVPSARERFARMKETDDDGAEDA